MNKITTFIITMIIFFSSIYITNAEEWYIEKLLDINYWVEKYELDLAEIDYYNFKSDKYNYIYKELKRIDSILKEDIIKKYRSWEYNYYQVNWIIKNYNDFIYHNNMFFYYIKLKEQNNNYKELDSAIIKSYTNLRNSYKKIINIIKRDY